PPCGALFPYTTLFRSLRCGGGYGDGRRAVAGAHDASVRRAARSARAHHVSCVRKPSAAASLPAWSAGESLSAKASQKSGKLRTRSEEHTSELQSRFDL